MVVADEQNFQYSEISFNISQNMKSDDNKNKKVFMT